MTVDTPIERMRFVGKKYALKIRRLGIYTVRDLLLHFPNRYEDYSAEVMIDNVVLDQINTIVGRIASVESRRLWKRKMSITTALIKDISGSIKAVWFNHPFLVRTLRVGMNISVSGKAVLSGKEIVLQHPQYEIIRQQADNKIQNARIHTGRFVPIYPETEGITSRHLRVLIKSALPYRNNIQEILPTYIRKKKNFPIISTALMDIHFPQTKDSAARARKRFAFQELLLLQLRSLRAKSKREAKTAYPIAFKKTLIKKFVASLPFTLTDAQRRALWEIIQSIKKSIPMSRLLNGDVGSGKTVVALASLLQTAKQGFQGVLIAPTEVLARQHFYTAINIFNNCGITIGLLTGTESLIYEGGSYYETKKAFMKERIEGGQISLIIGTHALLQKSVAFKNLSLVVIDEQHRFGVRQRAYLLNAYSPTPHLLSMTATPIPRTMALAVYGDLDISVLDELPEGRKKIITRVVTPANRKKAYALIRQEIKRGKQVFVICPRIEAKEIHSHDSIGNENNQQGFLRENLRYEVKAVKSEHKKLVKEVFPNMRIAMMHGKLKPKEKREIMERFKEKKYDIIVATSVIEVGVDVPNASVMMIEGAERFGLAQLHQFRGRVGRARHQSYCFLFIENPDIERTRRLATMEKTNNGFELAEMDLKIRGPGEFLGTQQSGIPDIAMSSLADTQLIKSARAEAEMIIKKGLHRFPLLKKHMNEVNPVHLE